MLKEGIKKAEFLETWKRKAFGGQSEAHLPKRASQSNNNAFISHSSFCVYCIMCRERADMFQSTSVRIACYNKTKLHMPVVRVTFSNPEECQKAVLSEGILI